MYKLESLDAFLHRSFTLEYNKTSCLLDVNIISHIYLGFYITITNKHNFENKYIFTDPPVFDEAIPEITVGVENEPLIVVLRADGNPSSITYTWTKDGLPITQSSYSNSSKFI